MTSSISWRDIAYLSDDAIKLLSDGRLELSEQCRANPLFFVVALLEAAHEAQRRANALLPVTEQKNIYSLRIFPNAIPSEEVEEGLDATTFSLTVAIKKDKNILKEV